MPIKVTCPNAGCGATFTVPEDAIGRRGKCPACGGWIVVPTSSVVLAEQQPNSPRLPESRANFSTASTTASGVLRHGRQREEDNVRELGRFQIRGAIGRGSFGMVYRAYDPHLDREVALKLPRPEILDNPRRVERFLREARAAAQLRHPFIVPVFETGRIGDRYYIASAYIEGKSLDRLLRKQPGGFEFRRAAKIVADLAEATMYAHDQGIVHRDIKPANVILDAKDRPHLLDFGLAARIEGEEKMTRDGSVLGTPSYMAPEQAAGQSGDAKPSSDQYSLGVVLYELLTGKAPFEGPAAVVVHQVIHEEPEPPSKRRPDLPRDLETICMKALAKRPEDRYADCQAFADDLRRWLDGEPITARRHGPIERFQRWRAKNPLMALLIALIGVTLLLGVVVAGVFAQLAQSEAQNATAKAEEARQAQLHAEAEQQRAQAEAEKALRAEKTAQQIAAESMLSRSLSLCEQGDLSAGLLWMARAAELAHQAEASALEEACRWNLAAWRSEHPTLLQVLPHPEAVVALASLEQGRTTVTACKDGKVRFWETATGRLVGKTLDHPDAVMGLAASPNSDRLATTCRDGKLRLWDATLRSLLAEVPLKSLPSDMGVSLSVAWDGPGQQLIVAGFRGAAIHSARDAAFLRYLHPDPNGGILSVEAVAAADDGTLVMVDRSTQATLWPSDLKQPLRPPLRTSPKGERTVAVALKASATQSLLAVGHVTDPTARVWDWRQGREIASAKHSLRVLSVAFAAVGDLWATASEDGTARLWSWSDNRPVSPPLRHASAVRACQFTPDGGRLLTASDDKLVRVWQVPQRRLHRWFRHAEPVQGLAFAPDSTEESSIRLAAGMASGSKALKLWNAVSGQLLAEADASSEGVADLAFARDGRAVFYCGNRPRPAVFRWDLSATASEAMPLSIHLDELGRLAVSKDGQWLAVGSLGLQPAPRGSNVKLLYLPAPWGTPQAEKLLQHQGRVLGLAFSPDSKRLLTGSHDFTTQFWELATGQPIGTAQTHPTEVTAVAIAPDGQWYATAGVDRTIRLWDMQTHRPIGTAMQHRDAVLRVQFTPDGKLLLSTSLDGTARFWHPATGNPIGPALTCDAAVLSADCSLAGVWVATGSADGMVRVWRRPSLELTDLGKGSVSTIIERQLGLRIDEQEAIRVLTGTEWKDRDPR